MSNNRRGLSLWGINDALDVDKPLLAHIIILPGLCVKTLKYMARLWWISLRSVERTMDTPRMGGQLGGGGEVRLGAGGGNLCANGASTRTNAVTSPAYSSYARPSPLALPSYRWHHQWGVLEEGLWRLGKVMPHYFHDSGDKHPTRNPGFIPSLMYDCEWPSTWWRDIKDLPSIKVSD